MQVISVELRAVVSSSWAVRKFPKQLGCKGPLYFSNRAFLNGLGFRVPWSRGPVVPWSRSSGPRARGPGARGPGARGPEARGPGASYRLKNFLRASRG